MGLGDKIHNAAAKLHGRSQEAAGRASGNERLRSEGRARHIRADLKQAGEKIKDAFRRH
ncbi:MAG TPA: CsbD family protein [Arthrobacter sp.]|nr:CsbD family protein [Arthrobacter sp.]